MKSAMTYLTSSELSALIKYDSRTIREQLKDKHPETHIESPAISK